VAKWWGVFFGVVLLACFLLTALAPLVTGWGLPENLSTFGKDVDNLYYMILGMTGFFFVLTEALLVYAMWSFAHRAGAKSHYTHGNHRLELFWTLIPAGLLLFIAIVQIKTWERIKYQSQMPTPDQIVQVTGRQWEWRIRHATDTDLDLADSAKTRRWAEAPQADDVHVVNELHTWKGAKVKIYLKTQDVIHSFFLPNLRLKQDALPGKTIPMWFSATRANMIYNPETKTWEHDDDAPATFEIACAELCGGRHYQMRGLLCVHDSKEYFDQWLDSSLKQQKSYKREVKPAPAVSMLGN
jgi:cytochrome c oxidase subunit 2